MYVFDLDCAEVVNKLWILIVRTEGGSNDTLVDIAVI